MEIKPAMNIEDTEGLRTAIVLLNNEVTKMSNANTTDDVIKAYMSASGLLISLYRFNIGRTTPKTE